MKQKTPLNHMPHSRSHRRLRRNDAEGGFTLLEVAIACTVLTLAVGAVAQSITTTSQLSGATREREVALEGAIATMETIRATPLTEVLASYNDAEDDDPDGAGTAPGATFEIAGIDGIDGAPAGTIVLPTRGTQLREDFDDDSIGMPRDLNADGVISSDDVTDSAVILPVCIRVDWRGNSGNQRIELYTTLVDA